MHTFIPTLQADEPMQHTLHRVMNATFFYFARFYYWSNIIIRLWDCILLKNDICYFRSLKLIQWWTCSKRGPFLSICVKKAITPCIVIAYFYTITFAIQLALFTLCQHCVQQWNTLRCRRLLKYFVHLWSHCHGWTLR